MPNQDDYRKVAEELKSQLGRKTFLTLTRSDVTDMLRRVSNSPTTRIKVLGSQAITDELEKLGLTFYPDLYDVGSHDALRLFRSDSFIMDLIEIINEPSDVNDMRLRLAMRALPKTEAEDDASRVPVAASA